MSIIRPQFGIWVWYLGLVYVAFGFTYIIFLTFFVKYLVTEFGYTGMAAGKLFMLMGGCSLFSGIIWGLVSDLIGRKKTFVILYAFIGAGSAASLINNAAHQYIIGEASSAGLD